jgi:hypothetical protein
VSREALCPKLFESLHRIALALFAARQRRRLARAAAAQRNRCREATNCSALVERQWRWREATSHVLFDAHPREWLPV